MATYQRLFITYLRFENHHNASSEQKAKKRIFQYQIQAGTASFGVFNTDQYILKGNVCILYLKYLADSFYRCTVHCGIYVLYTHQYMHYLLNLEKFKIYIKRHINIAPTCFGLRPSSGSLYRACLKLYFC